MVTLTLKSDEPPSASSGSKLKRPSQASTSSRQSIVLARSSFVASEKDLITVGGPEGTHQTDPATDKIGTTNCMFLLFSGAMGAGVLSLPTVVQKNGFFLGSLLLCIGGVFSAVAEYYLMKCTRVANEEQARNGLAPISSYSALLEFAARKAWPRAGSTSWVQGVLNAIFVIYLWAGVIVAMTQSAFRFADSILSDFDDNGFKQYIVFKNTAKAPEMTWGAVTALAGVWWCLCLPKDMSALKVISPYPFIAIMSTVCFVVGAFFAIPKWNGVNSENWTGVAGKSAGESVPLLFSSSNHILAVLALSGRFVFAYMTHTNVVTCAVALEDKSDAAALKISLVNVAVIAAFYVMISLTVVAVHGEALSIPFTSNYTQIPEVKLATKVICTMLAFVVVAAIPLNFPPLRQALFDLYLQITGQSVSKSGDENDDLVASDSSEDEGMVANDARQLLPKSSSSAKTTASPEEMSLNARVLVTTLLIGTAVFTAKNVPEIGVVIDHLTPFGVLVMIGFPAFMMHNILDERDSSKAKFWSRLMFAYALFGLLGFAVANMPMWCGVTKSTKDGGAWTNVLRQIASIVA